MIRLNVFIQVEKQNYDQVVSIAKELVAASQKDNGCVAYDLFQSTTRQDVLKDAASLAAHEQAAHFTTLVPKIQELAAMKLEKFEF